MKITLISDTHTHHRRLVLPAGDILIHAGDLTTTGRVEQADAALRWLAEQAHPHKVLIAGNHDWCFLRQSDTMRELCRKMGLTYLEDSGADVSGLKIWGSPYTPEFAGWAFMEEGLAIRKHWDMIPSGLDILITHGPPFGVLDRTMDDTAAGCKVLREAVDAKSPRLHCFGHIHEAAGATTIGATRFVNAARSIAQVRIEPEVVMVEWSKAL